MVYEVATKLKKTKSRRITSGTKRLLKDLFSQINCSEKEMREIGRVVLSTIEGLERGK